MKVTDMGEVVFTHDKFTVKEFQGRYWMLIDGQRVAELINGADGLLKQYKGSFELWYRKIREKKMNTVESYINQAEELLEKAEELRKVWNLPNNS